MRNGSCAPPSTLTLHLDVLEEASHGQSHGPGRKAAGGGGGCGAPICVARPRTISMANPVYSPRRSE